MKPLLTLILSLSLTFTSCTSIRYLDIQVLNPTDVKLPNRMDNIYFVINQQNNHDSCNSGGRKFAYGFYSSLKKRMQESPIFENSAFHICTEDSLKSIIKNSSYLEQPNSGFFTIDSLFLKDSVYSVNSNILSFVFSVLCKMKLSINGPNKSISLRHNEIFYWGHNSFINYRTKSTIKDSAFSVVGSKVGKLMAAKISPWWTTETRIMFFNKNKSMQRAFDYYLNDSIYKAMNEWKRVYNIGSNSLASIAAHNVGLCYEILDNIELCDEWLLKSVEKRSKKITKNYQEQIKKRKNIAQQLDKQILSL